MEIIFVLSFIIMLFICFEIADIADKRNDKYITNAIPDYIKKLLVGRNLFGIILSSVIVMISVPAFILIVLVQIMVSLVRLLNTIWQLGNKK